MRVNGPPFPPAGELTATNVFAKRFGAGNVKITWDDITVHGVSMPGQPDGYAVEVSGGNRETLWGLVHLETIFGDPLRRGNRYTVEHPTSTDQGDENVAFTYTLKLIGDRWLAPSKTFLQIQCPGPGSAAAVDCSTTVQPTLKVFDVFTYEDHRVANFRVQLGPAASQTVTVDYATADRPSGRNRALAGQDYVAKSGTLSFGPGQTDKWVAVTVLDDAVNDSEETFYLNLSNAAGATIGDGQGVAQINNTEALTATFEQVPEAHDGSSAFRFRVAFSEDIGIDYKTLRDESFTATGGDITKASRVGGRRDLWEVTVEPASRDAVTITLPGDRDCGTAGAVCTRGERPRPLSNSPSATVEGPPEEQATAPLTASFDMPGEHTGDDFTFGLTFSEELDPGFSYRTLRGRGVRGDRRRGAEGEARAVGEQPGVDDHGRAGRLRGGDGPAAGDERLQRERRDLHRRRPAAVQLAVGDGRRPGGHLGGRCAGGGRRRGGAGLRGRAQPRGKRDADRGLRHVGRQRAGGRGLYGGERHADVPGGRVVEDGRGGGARRCARRGRGDADADAVERLVGPAGGWRGDRDDQEPGPAAAGAAGALRADGGGAPWSSTSRNGSRRRASRGSGASSRAASCGAAWSARWR